MLHTHTRFVFKIASYLLLLYKTFYIKATDKMLEALLLPDWDSLGCSLIPQAVASADGSAYLIFLMCSSHLSVLVICTGTILAYKLIC